MDNLEWYWKMRNGSLNLDTRYNIFCGMLPFFWFQSVYLQRLISGIEYPQDV